MQHHGPPLPRLRARYEAWEQSAGEILLVVGTCVILSLFVRIPNPMFAIGSFAAGVVAFIAWRSALRGQTLPAFAWVVVSVSFALGALSTALNQPLTLLMVQGIGLLAVALFSGILMLRRKKSPSSTAERSS